MSDLVSKIVFVKLLQDEEIINEVINEFMENDEAMSDLAEDTASELADLIEDDPEFKKRLLESALKNTNFKKKIMNELIDEIAD